MLVRKLQQCEQRRRQERGIKGEIILIKLAGAGDNDQVTALNAGPKYENQSQKLFLDLGLMLLFRAGRVPASPTNANGNGVTTNIYEEVGNILIGLRIIRLRQTKLDIGLSLPEPEPPELRTPHINIWDMIYNKREGGSVLPRQPGWSPPAGSQGWTGPWSCWRTTGYRSSPRPEVGPPRSSARPGTGFRT